MNCNLYHQIDYNVQILLLDRTKQIHNRLLELQSISKFLAIQVIGFRVRELKNGHL